MCELYNCFALMIDMVVSEMGGFDYEKVVPTWA